VQRKRDYEKRKADADFDRRERDRLRLEMLKDKAERIAKREGAAPADLLAQIAALSGVGVQPSAAAVAAASPATAKEALTKALAGVAAFKSGGAGGIAAATLRTLVKNALEQPDNPKFRSVNLANAAIRERLVAVTGSIAFLKAAGEEEEEEGMVDVCVSGALLLGSWLCPTSPSSLPCLPFTACTVGWEKDDDANALVLKDANRSEELLKTAMAALDGAIAARQFE